MAWIKKSEGRRLIALCSNHREFIAIVAHFLISGKVVDFNCCSVFAETTTVELGMQLNIQILIHARKADFPIPRPEARAIFKSVGSRPWVTALWFWRM